MSLIFPFVYGFLAAIVALILPGLINMTAAKVSLLEGKNQALTYIFGALLVIAVQAYVSIIFAQYIDKHEEVVVMLRQIGLFVFVVLTVYFLKFAKKPEFNDLGDAPARSKRSNFFRGVGISSLNVLPIPYYVVISMMLASYGVFTFQPIPTYSLVLGIIGGSFATFYFYVVFFNKMKSKADFFINNINKIVGGITGLVSLLTLINLLKYYFK